MSRLSRFLQYFTRAGSLPKRADVRQPVEFLFHNTSERSITVILEIWAEEVEVQPGSQLLLKTFAADIQTEITPKYYIVYLNTGAEVFLDQKKLWSLT